MTTPDLLTLLRAVAGIPVILLLARGDGTAAFVVFALAALSDAADGWLARRGGATSRHGELFDPLADKALVLCALLGLALVRGVDPLLAGAIASRELAVAAVRSVRYARGTSVPAGWGTKLKTLAEMAGLAALLPRPRSAEAETIGVGLLWIALVLGVATLPAYLAAPRRRLT